MKNLETGGGLKVPEFNQYVISCKSYIDINLNIIYDIVDAEKGPSIISSHNLKIQMRKILTYVDMNLKVSTKFNFGKVNSTILLHILDEYIQHESSCDSEISRYIELKGLIEQAQNTIQEYLFHVLSNIEGSGKEEVQYVDIITFILFLQERYKQGTASLDEYLNKTLIQNQIRFYSEQYQYTQVQRGVIIQLLLGELVDVSFLRRIDGTFPFVQRLVNSDQALAEKVSQHSHVTLQTSDTNMKVNNLFLK